MKTVKLLAIICVLQLVNLVVFGQAQSRIHILNSSGGIVLEKSKGDFIKLKDYSLIETRQDSLYFSNENKPISIGVEKGKNYYFLVIKYAQAGFDTSRSGLKVEEVSGREFFMTLLINKHGRKPDEVFTF